MKKHDHGKDDTAPPAPQPGVVNLLESAAEAPSGDETGLFCRRVSDTIYQCLTESGCRYKFTYETIHLCSWPCTGNPDRTHDNLPCHCNKEAPPAK